MPERPLVLFAQPATADKEKRHGGSPKFYRPMIDKKLDSLLNLLFYNELLKTATLE